MQLISNSQDILFLVLALCALWLTAFLAWFLYYAIMTFKQTYQVVHKLKEKITSTASYLEIAFTGIRKAIELFSSSSEEKKSKRKR